MQFCSFHIANDKIIAEEKLKPEQTKTFVKNAFRDGGIKETGTEIDKILPPVPLFSRNKVRTEKKSVVLEKLRAFFEKYFGI